MKIFIVSAPYFPNASGGAGRSTQGLAEEVVTRVHEVIVAAVIRKGCYETAAVKGVRIRYFPDQSSTSSGRFRAPDGRIRL